MTSTTMGAAEAEELSKKYPPIKDYYVVAKNAGTSTNKVDPNPILKDEYTRQILREIKAEIDRKELQELTNRVTHIEADPMGMVERLNLQAKKELEAQARIEAERNADKRTPIEKTVDLPGKMFGNNSTAFTDVDLLRDNPIFPRGRPSEQQQAPVKKRKTIFDWDLLLR